VTESGPSRIFLTREKIEFVRNSDWYLFGSGEIQNELKVTMSFCYVSFWTLIVPLTLLSAYLILWPRRKRVASTKPRVQIDPLAPAMITKHESPSSSLDRNRSGVTGAALALLIQIAVARCRLACRLNG
jgi:hypothetical protein